MCLRIFEMLILNSLISLAYVVCFTRIVVALETFLFILLGKLVFFIESTYSPEGIIFLGG